MQFNVHDYYMRLIKLIHWIVFHLLTCREKRRWATLRPPLRFDICGLSCLSVLFFKYSSCVYSLWRIWEKYLLELSIRGLSWSSSRFNIKRWTCPLPFQFRPYLLWTHLWYREVGHFWIAYKDARVPALSDMMWTFLSLESIHRKTKWNFMC